MPVRPFGVAMIRPDGRLSEKLIPDKEVDWLGLLILKVKVVVSPVRMGEAEKAFVKMGGAIAVSVAVP